MKKIILVLTLLMLLAGCKMGGIRGSGTRKTEKKELPAFKAVETGGAFDVEITCQKPQSVGIEADDNLLPLIETDVSDGVLHVGMKQNYHSSKLIALRIAVPDLNRITINGAGTARVTGVKNENFVINSTGAAKIEASGETKAVVPAQCVVFPGYVVTLGQLGRGLGPAKFRILYAKEGNDT